MKYLIWGLLIALLWWAWRRSRAGDRGANGGGPASAQPPATTAATDKPQPMITCAQCGLHVPHEDAVAGQRGQYCSAAHRSAAQDRNPSSQGG